LGCKDEDMCVTVEQVSCVCALLLACINRLPLKIRDIKTTGPVHLAISSITPYCSQPEESIPLAYVAWTVLVNF
jgi:hypothetical protein